MSQMSGERTSCISKVWKTDKLHVKGLEKGQVTCQMSGEGTSYVSMSGGRISYMLNVWRKDKLRYKWLERGQFTCQMTAHDSFVICYRSDGVAYTDFIVS